MGGVSSACGEDVTRTWDFTASGWSSISKPANATVYYYATTGTAPASDETAYNNSEAVAIHATNAFSYTASQGYSFGTNRTTVTDNVPSHDYFSVVVPVGYTLKVTGQLLTNNNYSNCFNISAGTTFRYQYNAAINSLQEGVYTNCTNAAVTAYIYNTATTNRPLQIQKIILTNTLATELTAVSEYTKWDFTNRPYTATYDGMILDNIYLGSGIKQVSNSYIYFPTALESTPTSAGENMVSFKAGVAGRVIMKLQYYSKKTVKVSDGSSEVASFTGDNTASYSSENLAAFDVEADKQYYLYAATVDNEKKDALINSFYMLSDEDKKDVIENKSKYSLDEIEAKLSVICVRKKVNFDSEDTDKNENTVEDEVMTYNLNNEGSAIMPEWLKALKNTRDSKE